MHKNSLNSLKKKQNKSCNHDDPRDFFFAIKQVQMRCKSEKNISIAFSSRSKFQDGGYDDHVDNFHPMKLSIKIAKMASD